MTEMEIRVQKQKNVEDLQWQNRIESAKQEYANIQRQTEVLKNEIGKKTDEYNLFLSTRDAEIKKQLDDLKKGREKLETDRVEFVSLLRQLQTDKDKLTDDRSNFEGEKNKIVGQKAAIDQFVITLQRAYSLLG